MCSISSRFVSRVITLQISACAYQVTVAPSSISQVEQLEPPFVWLYRKDYLHPRMRSVDLWKILQWDQEFEKLFALRQQLLRVLQALRVVVDVNRGPESELVRHVSRLICFHFSLASTCRMSVDLL